MPVDSNDIMAQPASSPNDSLYGNTGEDTGSSFGGGQDSKATDSDPEMMGDKWGAEDSGSGLGDDEEGGIVVSTVKAIWRMFDD